MTYDRSRESGPRYGLLDQGHRGTNSAPITTHRKTKIMSSEHRRNPHPEPESNTKGLHPISQAFFGLMKIAGEEVLEVHVRAEVAKKALRQNRTT